MNRSKLKIYAPQARRDFIQAVTDRAALYGLTASGIAPMTVQGDVAMINGTPFPAGVADKRHRLEERINQHGFQNVMEAMAYTWFNRLVAIRYMEMHGYLSHGYRVLGHRDPDKTTPEILEHAEHIHLPGLSTEEVLELKIDGTKEAQLYRMILVAQCNALHEAMPFLFERIADETELLLPDNLLHSDSIIRKLLAGVDDADWQQVEIIGWLYQFYISEKKDQVIGKVVKSEDIPAATQLFTPNWIVKYLVHNALGRQWLATYPNSALRGKMEYYIEPAPQTPEVQARLKAITPESLNPEELTVLDPACGSGHILVEAYDLLREIYLERGYRLREIPKLILNKNLFGLEIDDRAAQLAAFALLMKARADDPTIFDAASRGPSDPPAVQANIFAIQEISDANADRIVQAFTEKKITGGGGLSIGEFGFTGAIREPLFAMENLNSATADDRLAADLKSLLALFRHAKTFGSLITVPPELAQRLPALAEAVRKMLAETNIAVRPVALVAGAFVNVAMVLAKEFDAVIANPPYMGTKGMNAELKRFAGSNFPGAKSDLFAMFIERGFGWCKQTGCSSMVTMQSWMFLSSYERMREGILNDRAIQTMAHLGPRAFTEISGEVVQATAFVLLPTHVSGFRPAFFRLVDIPEEQKARCLRANQFRFDNTVQDDFKKIPGSPVAYWVSERMREAFQKGRPLGEIAEPRQGLATSDNARFLRHWQEVDVSRVGFGMENREQARNSGKKWFPYNKGGGFRRWNGNSQFVVDYEADGQAIKAAVKEKYGSKAYAQGMDLVAWVVKNQQFYFRASVTWSKVSSGLPAFRLVRSGFVFDVAGTSIFYRDEAYLLGILGFANSIVTQKLLKIISPTLNFEVGHICSLPFVTAPPAVRKLVEGMVRLSATDWDSFEISWDFQSLPVLQHKADTLRQSQEAADAQCRTRFQQMKQLEEENNRLFIEAYGLQGELSPEVPEDQITLYRPDRTTDMQRLISYCIGCAMGRYSLDKPGLIYAGSGNDGFDPAQYRIFPADQDGIIPITEMDWFDDDAGHRLEEFIAVAWPKEHLEENLQFVAEGLGAKSGETPRETIRRYLADEFFKDHLQTYKRRPIYWLFTSGRQKAFQCLVYLHRYNDATLARMRTEYVIPLLGRLNARIAQLEEDKAKATAPAHRKRLEKEQEMLRKQQAELTLFHDKLRHAADQRIKLDLDDGVKVNYAKFGDLLAGVAQVCGKAEED
jgi:type II restriction/modification system DNA methylase subunit YeeA